MKKNDPDVDEPHTRLDSWWAEIIRVKGYSSLGKIVAAALSIFSGPQVEASFTTMGDVIDKRACNMEISTYNAVQNVKSWVETEKRPLLVVLLSSSGMIYTEINKKR